MEIAVQLRQERSQLDQELVTLHRQIADQPQVDLERAIALLKSVITPKKAGGGYVANNGTGLKKLVEQALALLDKA